MRKKPEGRLGLNRNLKNLSYVDGAGLLRNPLAEVKKTYVFLPSAPLLCYCGCPNSRADRGLCKKLNVTAGVEKEDRAS
jgi:hypothetical protein